MARHANVPVCALLLMSACAACSGLAKEANRERIVVLAYVEERTSYSEVVSFWVYDPYQLVPQGLLLSYEPRYTTRENLVTHGTLSKRLVRETAAGGLGVVDRVMEEECSRFSLELAKLRNVTSDLSAVLTGRGTYPVFVCEDGTEIIGVDIVRSRAPEHDGLWEDRLAGASKRIVKAGAYWVASWRTGGREGMMSWEMALPAIVMSEKEASGLREWIDSAQLLRCR